MRLTGMARGGGCGCKLGRSALADALAHLPLPVGPDVLAGFDGAEDAAVVRVRDDLAVVASVDFFTPIVDEPEAFGAIAAVNALSDLYAMGAAPLFALAVAAWPDDADTGDLATVLSAGAEAAMAEGCPVLGGHTISDPEPKYGLAVIGTAHPQRLMRNAAGRPGDLLTLTKPIGTGVIATAAKRGLPAGRSAVGAAAAAMTASNRAAAAAATAAGVRCATDVTGFGLAGHLGEVAAASGCAAEIDAGSVPLLPAARDLAAAGVMTGGARRNRAASDGLVEAEAAVPGELLDLMHDPQTSGGLLLAAPPAVACDLRRRLGEAGVTHWTVGCLTHGEAGRVTVTAR